MAAISPSAIRERDRGAIRAALASRGVERAGVFGSVRGGKDTERSDLDLIVAFRPGVRRDLVGISDDLTAITGVVVDVVDRDRVLELASDEVAFRDDWRIRYAAERIVERTLRSGDAWSTGCQR